MTLPYCNFAKFCQIVILIYTDIDLMTSKFYIFRKFSLKPMNIEQTIKFIAYLSNEVKRGERCASTCPTSIAKHSAPNKVRESK